MGLGMPKCKLQQRFSDKFGQGHYGASRGKRKHKGQDYLCLAGSKILSDVDGEVTKLGYTYTDDPFYRYVQITTNDNHDVRYFYVHPAVNKGETVKKGAIIGVSQDLDKRYKGIPNHIHFEVKRDGEYIHPVAYLDRIQSNE